MPTYNICKQCGTPTATSDIGTNGVCKHCMIAAIEDSEKAKERLSVGTESNGAGEGFNMVNENDPATKRLYFPSKKKIAEHFGVSVQKVSAAIRFNKDINGWEFK